MVFLRKIKLIEEEPCIITKMDVDIERKRICLIDISNTIYIFNIQSLHNIVDQWRLQFQRDFDYKSIGQLVDPLYKFNPFEVKKPTKVKFSQSPCKISQIVPQSIIPQQPDYKYEAANYQTKRDDQLNKAQFQVKNEDQNRRNMDQSIKSDESVRYQQPEQSIKPKIMKSYTTVSEKSNKKIKINMIYSTDQSVIQDSEYSSQKDLQPSTFEDLYAIALLDWNVSLNEWVKVGSIKYRESQYTTLDFTWSKQSKYLFVVYSDQKLVQYDTTQQFAIVINYKNDQLQKSFLSIRFNTFLFLPLIFISLLILLILVILIILIIQRLLIYLSLHTFLKNTY